MWGDSYFGITPLSFFLMGEFVSDRKYKIVFRGDIASSADVMIVKKKLTQALQTSPEFIDAMFTRSETCIKSDLRQELAQKIKDHLQRTGAKFLIIPDHRTSLSTNTLSEEAMTKSNLGVRKNKMNKKQCFFYGSFLFVFTTIMSIHLWSSSIEQSIEGPSQLVFHDEFLYLVIHKELLKTHASDGKIIMRKPLLDLGILGDVADINIDREGYLWLGDLEGKRILRCTDQISECHEVVSLSHQLKGGDENIKAKALPENLEEAIIPDHQFYFRVVQEMDHIYVSETASHVMRMFDLHGKELFVSQPQTIFPQRMIWKKDQVLLADWGDQKIAVLGKYDLSLQDHWPIVSLVTGEKKEVFGIDEDDDMFDDDMFESEHEGEIKSATDLLEINSPIQMVSDYHSGTWLLCSDLLLSRFQLLHLNKKNHLVGRYDLPKSLAVSIASFHNGHVLVADREYMRVMQFNEHGERLADFGSDELKEVFLAHQEQKNFYHHLSVAMIYVLLLLLLIVMGFYYRSRQGNLH